jgi:hypothetical protein
MVIQMNNNVMRFGTSELNMKLESILIPVSLFYFVICLVKPEISINPVTQWFSQSVDKLYETPVIGWIFAFIGILMLIGLLLRSLVFTSLLINRLAGRTQGGNRNKKDDDFTDYEIMD